MVSGEPAKSDTQIHSHALSLWLFAEILQDLAKTVSEMPPADAEHRNVLREGARALYRALGAGPETMIAPEKRGAPMSAADPSQMTPEEEVLPLHVME